MWSLWWVWMAGGLVLAILEVLAPGFILLGFAIGALIVGLLLLLPSFISAILAGSLPITLLIFAVVSGVAWYILRRMVGIRAGQVKISDKDIND
ncbi:MAG: hypothetical protein ABJO67_04400 [Pseudoruegeria sp.]